MKRKCQLLTKENYRLRQQQHQTSDTAESDEVNHCKSSSEDVDVYEGKGAAPNTNRTREVSMLSMADNVIELESKNQRLRNQVHEMESFLKDYGLIWVGRNEGANDHADALKPEIDFAIFFARLEELNELAGV